MEFVGTGVWGYCRCSVHLQTELLVVIVVAEEIRVKTETCSSSWEKSRELNIRSDKHRWPADG